MVVSELISNVLLTGRRSNMGCTTGKEGWNHSQPYRCQQHAEPLR